MSQHEDFALRAMHDWAATLPALDATGDELTLFIRLSRVAAIQHRLDERALRTFEAVGVRGIDDFRTLALLRRSPTGLTNSELIEQLGGSKAGVSARLSRMADHQITHRTPSAVDRRSHTNSLTEYGAELTDRMVKAVVASRKLLTSTLASEEVGTLTSLLARIIEHSDRSD